jgi:hypothetical protein
MTWKKEQCLTAIRLKNDGKTNRQIGKAIGKTMAQVQDAWRRNKKLRALMSGDDTYSDLRKPYMKSRMAAGKQVAFHRIQADRPYSEEEFCELFGVDLERWTPEGKMEHTQWAGHFRTMMRFVPNLKGMVASEKWDDLMLLMQLESPHVPLDETLIFTTGIMYLIEVPDAHLGMMSWGPETGNDWDLKIAVGEYKRAFRHLLMNRPRDTERLVLRFGDDLLHYDKVVDGKIGTTHKGTAQDIDSRYPKLYSAVAKMLIELVNEATAAVPQVSIVIVPGNHDKVSCFTLGELVEARFWNDDRVEVDNEPTEFKVFRWGANLLGFHHGHGSKADFLKLPDTLKQRARKAWGETLYAEIHTGDKHHEAVVDERMVLMRKLKALCPNDSWHTEGQWDSYRGAQAFAYTKAPGVLTQEYYHSSFMFKDDHPLTILGEV